jgi:nitrogen regulatory protein P-II 1
MKKVEAIIRPHLLDAVKLELGRSGVGGLTAYEVKGFGRQKGHTEMHGGHEYVVDFLPKIKLEILVSEVQLIQVVEAIMHSAHTGKIGDGKITVSPIEDVIRIRTKEHGDMAI